MPTKLLRRRPLTIREILAWASAHREATGKWPNKSSGSILGAKFEKWGAVDAALREGLRDLPGGSSLARLLAERLGARNVQDLPSLDEEKILEWADAHRHRTGTWPTAKSGSIPDSGGEQWPAIDMALRLGVRSLPAGSSLPQLLAKYRGVRNRKQLPPLTEEKLLEWADSHFGRTAAWPNADSGAITGAPGETWLAADMALRHGQRGLTGGSSLARFLTDKRQVRNLQSLPSLSAEQILIWVDAFHERWGSWPHLDSGLISDTNGETWNGVNHALKKGSRGLDGGLSLAKLLARQRGVRNPVSVPGLTRKQILSWADEHRRRTRQWPSRSSGPIQDAPEETWNVVDAALIQGSRGLRRGSSLARLLAQYRNRRNHHGQSPLSKRKIVAWADAHHERTGKWPNINSGPVHDAPNESWNLIDNALRQGNRKLPGGSSLIQVLAKKRGVRNPMNLPPLTEELIIRWAQQHFERTGAWPKCKSGFIAGAQGETWSTVDTALRCGKRGLAAGSSLARLLARNRSQESAEFQRWNLCPSVFIPG